MLYMKYKFIFNDKVLTKGESPFTGDKKSELKRFIINRAIKDVIPLLKENYNDISTYNIYYSPILR